MSFSRGDLVFVPCPEQAFLAGSVVDLNGDDTAQVRTGAEGSAESEVRNYPVAELRPRFAWGDRSTSQDNTSLEHMNDATILDNLARRHKQDEIYTYTASVLLAVNPYKEIPAFYTEEQCARYRGKHIGALPPHPYAIADASYRALVRERRNQALLISGESGAGKTETAKIVMQYLSYASGASCDLAGRIQTRVLQAQPILESFGNAATMRNSNSSRFGKYNRVFFAANGQLADAGVTTYLLESSRVVVHSEKERNYHCFYELLAGLDEERLTAFRLDRSRRYRLLTPSGGPDAQPAASDAERDRRNFRRLCEALTVVGFSEEDVTRVLRLLAGLLHLGDVLPVAEQEGDDSEKAGDLDDEAVERAAELLGMDADSLASTLKRKRVAVPGRDSFHEVPRTAAQLRQALQSLVKALYKRLFELTVQRINESFKELRPEGASAAPAEEGDEEGCRHIGILDIYGFERLQRNSFEQLCINLANERLQQYFVENVLVAEQSLYRREGLRWEGLTLPDSQPVVHCVAQVFRALDEYSQQLAKGFETASDEKFCQKALDEAAKDPTRKEVLKQLKMSGKGRGRGAAPAMNEGFSIRHYAGCVEYSTRGWLDKNNDRLLAECESLICTSTAPLVKSLGEEDQGKTVFRSISKKYVSDLDALLKTLGSCSLHYIRCFKPNEEQKPNLFKKQMVLDQIVQCGTIELVRIMHDGYPNRCAFEEITARFRDLLPEQFQRYGTRTFIEALMLAYEVPREEWVLGMSRLFLKAGQLSALENMRSGGAKPKAENLTRIVRQIVQKRWCRAGHAVMLCNYVPKFIAEIQARKLRARQRLRGAFYSARLALRLMREAKQRRVERLGKALRLACFIVKSLKGPVAAARAAAEAKAEERRKDEVARRVEEEMQRRRERERREREEAEAAAKRKQEQNEEAERRAEEERRERERLAEEKQAEERKTVDEERRKLEEEKRQLMMERQAFEKERRMSIMAQPTPQQKSDGEEGLSARQPRATRAGSSSCLDEAESGVTTSLTNCHEEDEVYPGDSVSAAMVASHVQQEVAHQMNERIRALETEMQRKQEEVVQQMRFLQEKNACLERTLKEQGRPPREGESPLLLGSPAESGTPHSSGKPHIRSARRHSLIECKDSRMSLSGKAGNAGRSKRLSVAHEALSALRDEGNGGTGDRPRCLGDAPARSQNILSQRKWWAQQRQFLLEDLHPSGSPGGAFAGYTPGGRAPGQRRASQATTAASTGKTPSTVSGFNEVRNLNMMFEESAEDEGSP